MTQEQIEKAALDKYPVKMYKTYGPLEGGGLLEVDENLPFRKGFIEGATYALEHQWVSVEDALPKERFDDDGYEFVFVIVKVDEETSYYDTDYIRNGEWELHTDKITHWMPIQSLPKGGEK